MCNLFQSKFKCWFDYEFVWIQDTILFKYYCVSNFWKQQKNYTIYSNLHEKENCIPTKPKQILKLQLQKTFLETTVLEAILLKIKL